jgi:hypothetical protein
LTISRRDLGLLGACVTGYRSNEESRPAVHWPGFFVARRERRGERKSGTLAPDHFGPSNSRVST